MNRNAWIAIAVVVLGTIGVRYACRHKDPKHEGKIRQTAHIRVAELRRGATGTVIVGATASFTTHEMDKVQQRPVTDIEDIALAIVDATGTSKPLPVERWQLVNGEETAKLALPAELLDGDYKIHATFETHLGKAFVDVPVPLYTPARIHVITDRPLYEPGNVIRFRAVALRARDLVPLDGRPGRWIVKDPDGEVLLEEKAPAGDWGVVAGSFPLDRQARTGTWRVSWVSADAVEEVPVTVQPFVLPRFHVDAATDKPFYQASDKPVIKGAVLYSSGAPVGSARLEIAWSADGDWPPPTEWLEKTLPQKSQTAATGHFELALPQIPTDLQGRSTITARISAIDPAGDRVASSVSVLLSQDAIRVSAVTELADGLIQSQNNRVYLRVTTADGRALPGNKITVTRAWEATDPGIAGALDEDGVASLNLDPGSPVNVVIPAAPYRPAPKQALVARGAAQDLIGGEAATLADQIEMDKWLAALAPCAKWFESSDAVKVGLRVESSGTIVAVGAGPSRMGQCVAGIVRSRRLPAGTERMYALDFTFTDPQLSKLSPSIESALEVPDGFAEQINELALGARDCLPVGSGDGDLPVALAWHATAGKKEVELGGWFKDPKGGEAAAAVGCAQARFAGRIALANPVASDALGFIRFGVELPESATSERPQATTLIGYELAVATEVDGKPASTKIRFAPGTLPNVRMRVTPVLPKPGETVKAELLRSPDYTGVLPDELALDCLTSHTTAKLDAEHAASFAIAAGTEGWCTVTGADTRAFIYVRPQAELTVSIAPKQDRYAPGEQAELQILTKVGQSGGKAAVGLFGVDQSLGQLVPLPGADALAKLRPQVTDQGPIFDGALDGQALVLGRIRGANAAAATVLRVAEIPKPPELDAVVSAQAATQFDAIAELADHFYIVLAELHAQARAWEQGAPATEKMVPATLARLWNQALDACEKRGEPTDDAYGRRLRLALLPGDLLALTDPRSVIVVGTRLPEDFENWAAWVAREKP